MVKWDTFNLCVSAQLPKDPVKVKLPKPRPHHFFFPREFGGFGSFVKIYRHLDVLRNLSDEWISTAFYHSCWAWIYALIQPVYDVILDPERPKNKIWETSFITRDIPGKLLDFHLDQISVQGSIGEHIMHYILLSIAETWQILLISLPLDFYHPWAETTV